MRRLVAIFGLAVFLAGGGQGLRAAQSASTTQPKIHRFAPIADAYVTAAARRRNFGRAKVLRVQGRPVTRSYLRFDATNLDAPLSQVTLRFLSRSSSRGFSVRATGTNWSERGITFANAPSAGLVLGRSGRIRARQWVSVALDVARLPRGSGTLNLALTGAGATLASRESNARPTAFVIATPPTLIAAGDIADCTTAKDAETAALLADINNQGTIAALGDLAYESGTIDEFNNCYGPTWGRFKARTKPAPGNHEYGLGNAAGYFTYWGAVAGNPTQGWYSYDLGAWHLISLNSNCTFIGGCQGGSPQEAWLRADLAAHKNRCTAAYWHHPLFSGSVGTGELDMQPLWQALYDNNADLVLVGHAHNYQRFAPQNAFGAADPARGLREFVVGTGGRTNFNQVPTPAANTEALNVGTNGLLKLSLRNTGYSWNFIPVAGQTFTDSGSTACH